MNKLNDIFMKTESLTQEELAKYLSGNLSAAEKHAIELKLSADPLAAEALEGYLETGAGLSGFAAVSQQFHSRLSNPAGAASSGTGGFSQTFFICLGFAVASVAVLGIVNDSLNEKASPQVRNVTEEITPEPVTEEIVSQQVEEELVSAEPIAREAVMTARKTRENQPITVAPEIVENEPDPADPLPEPKSIEQLQAPNPKTIDIQTTVISNREIRYVYDLKVVFITYTNERRIKLRNMESVNSGVRAYSASGIEHINTPPSIQGPYIFVDYADFIDTAMWKYHNDNYRGALKDYKLIISHYPDDVNAHFYGALCYYNLGKPEKAIKYFDEVLKSEVNTFDQEAEFYKALSLKQAGMEQTAKTLFVKIRDEGKFYSKRAEQELKNF